jgi:isoquinoline 1-oxidoreductase beta subunit
MNTNDRHTHRSCALDRRQFLILSATGTAAFVLGILPKPALATASPATEALQPFAWIEIHTDNQIVFHLCKSEMGQGIQTSLAMLVAEELHIPLQQLRVQQAEYDPKYGDQATGGSDSIRSNWQPLREAAAVTREMLVAAAGKKWGVATDKCQALNGQIRHLGSGDTLTYGEVVDIARAMPLPSHVMLKTQGFHLIGTSPPRLDLPSKINGSARYGADIRLDGILTATVVHCPYFSGHVQSYDANAALRVPGVIKIFEISTGIAVVADTYWTASEAVNRLNIHWAKPAAVADAKHAPLAQYRALLDKPGVVIEQVGAQTAAAPAPQLEAIYELPYQAHATMEPMSCTAHINNGKIRVWAPTQNPQQAYSEAENHALSAGSRLLNKILRKLFHTRAADIRVEVTQLGGAFGRRLQQDFVAEAVQIAKVMARPVRLVWSREEDIQHDYYRPATVHRLTAQLDQAGAILDWHHKIVGGSINEYLWPGSTADRGDPAVTEGATQIPYATRRRTIEYVKLISTVPLGFWRAVGNSHTAFAKECFIDELAHAAQLDPVTYRRRLLQAQPEMIAVLEMAANQAGWGRPLTPGHYHGVAMHSSYGSHVAQVAEISIEADQVIRVHKVTCAIDCGTVINPDGVRAQIESAVVFGLSATLKSAITIEDGRVQQSNFHDFPILSMQEAPQVATYFIESTRPPAGVGEPGLPPIAPAVANAVFAATRQRLRTLPLRLT